MLLPTRPSPFSSWLRYVPNDLLSIARQETSSSAIRTNRSIWIIICVVLAVLLFVLVTLLVFRLLLRARRHSSVPVDNIENVTSPRRADRERLVFAYLPAQAPAIVRMQRLAKRAGLSPQELNSVAPAATYVRHSSNSSDIEENKSDDHVCAVCLEDMVDGSNTRRLPCGHCFDAEYVATAWCEQLALIVLNILTIPFLFFLSSCIEVWATKANRCPVCNASIIGEEELETLRLGRNDASEHIARQRRRRARGENGTFELAIVNEHNFLASESNASRSRTERNAVSGDL
eukprot:TRINITY_DN618_c0_g1_i1.p1 TRINITY_DN618_c0_g1~~TRINITY_DN618_c0_g1_i1.p1  ORF type:complete len:289 (-),score=37.94 TRINITY_DN618_c0_g1_i1:860-1726(-)